MTNRPRILLADDHRLVLDGLRALLPNEFEVVGLVEDGHAMIAAARELRPDLIIADITMPHLNGIEAFLQLRKLAPRAKVIFLTMHQEVAYARRALEAGAAGFLLKHAAAAELLLAIRTVLAGNIYVTPTLMAEVLQAMRAHPLSAAEPAATLTPRQREILQLVAEGRSAKEIAGDLSISARTVEFHKYHMMESLGLHNSTELVRFAIKHQLVAV